MRTLDLNLRHLKDPAFGNPPKRSNENVMKLAYPHIDSFNFFLEKGLESLHNIPDLEFKINDSTFSISFHSFELDTPTLPTFLSNSADRRLFPKECIERGCTYKAQLSAKVTWTVNDKVYSGITMNLGDIPIMIKSKKCHLNGMTPKELIKHGELANEAGGYFIINGGCRVLRLLIANRRNYAMALSRKTWKMRDQHFTEKGVMMRCVSKDETSSVIILHHLSTGGVKIEFKIERALYFLPLVMMLKVLSNFSDLFIFQNLIKGREKDIYYAEKIKMMLRELQNKKLYCQRSCKDYIGNAFRDKLIRTVSIPPWFTNEEICTYLLDNFILIHLNNDQAKFHTLCMMTRKLYAYVGGECTTENPDALSMQEASLGGHTFLLLVKEKVIEAQQSMRIQLLMKYKIKGDKYTVTEADLYSAITRAPKIGDRIQTFIATGSLKSKNRCGLMQDTGLTVMMDHLNRMRDLSHLRAIHRGAYFLEMKTIGPRRLTGEAWGFICPVHTPDGAPCGLLNHLAFDCEIPCDAPSSNKILLNALIDLGITDMSNRPLMPYDQSLEVILDGEVVGYICKNEAPQIVFKLRYLKVSGKIYKYTEIVLIEERDCVGQYACLVLATSNARLMRPVMNLSFRKIEFIGTLEQNYLNVAVSLEDVQDGVHSHMELSKTAMLSNLGKLVPFSDCNPNPRNMYQCQMSKQTMGTPIHNYANQTYSKLYRLQYPQVPLVRNSHYDDMNMEEFCLGFNACLAIVSYTGYDMEDAMVINKCAMERGLGHGQVYKTEFIDLAEIKDKKGSHTVDHIFLRDPKNEGLSAFLDNFGLPYPGTKLKKGDPYYCVYKIYEKAFRVFSYVGEDCIVDKYSLVNSGAVKQQCPSRACVTIRIMRYPIIGDKFASRSGQKGVMSRLYPMEDLPFNERGMVPDIIFNPHGIPSRMTAGTLIELVAGKCAAEFGKGFNSSPFEFDDENPAIDYYGKILEKAGFNYYGEDVLYSGTDGRMMEVKIFEGIVYYQRLRHMTADKWQVRSTGPMDSVTRQPIKGRKRGGAIRFGEMERDCLISHGAPYTLIDRLLYCSDASKEWVCTKCGSLLSALFTTNFAIKPTCTICGPEVEVLMLEIPYAFKYLVTELASVGIRTDLAVSSSVDHISNYPTVRLKQK